jgi:hypothetical protein
MMVGPMIAGSAAKWSGSAAAAFDFGALVLVMCPPLLWLFNRIASPPPTPVSHECAASPRLSVTPR